MRPAVAAVALACVAALAAPPAHADVQHSLTATCATPSIVVQFTGVFPVTAVAVAAGHVRPVSTEVVCTAYPGGVGDPVVARQALPGPVAAAAAAIKTAFPPTLCVSASAYWSDGDSLVTPTSCGSIAALTQASS